MLTTDGPLVSRVVVFREPEDKWSIQHFLTHPWGKEDTTVKFLPDLSGEHGGRRRARSLVSLPFSSWRGVGARPLLAPSNRSPGRALVGARPEPAPATQARTPRRLASNPPPPPLPSPLSPADMPARPTRDRYWQVVLQRDQGGGNWVVERRGLYLPNAVQLSEAYGSLAAALGTPAGRALYVETGFGAQYPMGDSDVEMLSSESRGSGGRSGWVALDQTVAVCVCVCLYAWEQPSYLPGPDG